jgi:hypothetical protein
MLIVIRICKIQLKIKALQQKNDIVNFMRKKGKYQDMSGTATGEGEHEKAVALPKKISGYTCSPKKNNVVFKTNEQFSVYTTG